MSSNNDQPKHITMISCDVISEICAPLFKYTPVKAFQYSQVYLDGSRAELGSHFGHLKQTFLDTKHMHRAYTPILIPSKEHLLVRSWISNMEINETSKALKAQLENQANNLGLGNEFAIVRRFKEYTEYYHYYSDPANDSVNNFYMGNIGLFERFAHYFREQAAQLIECVSKDRILKPWRGFTKQEVIFDSSSTSEFEAFVQETTLKKLYIGDSHLEYLTRREIQCSVQMIRGLSAAEIAARLSLSLRTVEKHIANIKSKLQCARRSELVQKLMQRQLHILFPE